MRYAVSENVLNIVWNVIEAETPPEIAGSTLRPSETANIGDQWNGTEFIPPPDPGFPGPGG